MTSYAPGRAAGPSAPDLDAEAARARLTLTLLHDANRSILGELSREEVLRRVVVAARDLVGARYVALGVLGEDGRLEEFVHEGMDEALAARPGTSPAAAGLMKVPILVRGSVLGHLYVADRADGTPLTGEDLRVVGAFGTSAGVAIENARLYESSTRRQRWAEVTAEVTTALLEPQPEVDPIGLVLEALHAMTQADLAAVAVPTSDPDLLLVTHGLGGASTLRGAGYPRPGTVPDHVLRVGRGVRISTPQERALYEGPLQDRVEIGPAMVLPMVADGRTYGVLMTGRRPGGRPFDDADLALGESFAAQAAVAMALTDARAQQERLVLVQDRERIARDLHDHVIQRLFASGLTLDALSRRLPSALAARVGSVVDDLDATIGEIRTMIFRLQSTDASPSLRSAVLDVAEASAASLGFTPTVVFEGPVDTVVAERTGSGVVDDVKAVTQEALRQAARHARPEHVSIQVQATPQRLRLTISDDGTAWGDEARRDGLLTLERSAARHGGTSGLVGAPAGGTEVRWSIPLD